MKNGLTIPGTSPCFLVEDGRKTVIPGDICHTELRLYRLENGKPNAATDYGRIDILDITEWEDRFTIRIRQPPQNLLDAFRISDTAYLWYLVSRIEAKGNFPGFDNPDVGYAGWRSFRGPVKHLSYDGLLAVVTVQGVDELLPPKTPKSYKQNLGLLMQKWGRLLTQPQLRG